MPLPTLNSEEPLNAPFGAQCFLTRSLTATRISARRVLIHLLVLGAF